MIITNAFVFRQLHVTFQRLKLKKLDIFAYEASTNLFSGVSDTEAERKQFNSFSAMNYLPENRATHAGNTRKMSAAIIGGSLLQ